MNTSNILVLPLVFILGIAAGVIASRLNDTAVEPVFSIDQQGVPGVSPALMARLDQVEARLAELTVAVNRVDMQRMGGVPPPGRSAPNEPAAKSPPTAARYEEVKNRLLNSLYDPATNITTLMNSNEMRLLSQEQQNEVMKEVAARLDSGQLNKEQFLPGYKK